MATIDIAMESTSQQILNKLNASSGSGGGYRPGINIFTSNGTFTVPENVGIIYVTACGGGGGGGGAIWGTVYRAAGGGAGGGGGAFIYKKQYSVTPGQQIPITIGVGGAGGAPGQYGNYTSSAVPNTKGGIGGSTIIGNLITLPGGQPGGRAASNNGSYGYANDSSTYYGAAGGSESGNGGIGDTCSGTSSATTSDATNGGDASVKTYATNPLFFYQIGLTASMYPAMGIGGLTGGTGNGMGGGGGASLGNGGGGNSSVQGTAPTYGGGGGGGYGVFTSSGGTSPTYSPQAFAHGNKGGDGIAIIEW